MMVGLGACSNSRGGSDGASTKVRKGATIGISMPTKSEERWNRDGNNLKAKLERLVTRLFFPLLTISQHKQNADIENMVNNVQRS